MATRRSSAKERAGQHTLRGKGVKVSASEKAVYRRLFDATATSIRSFIATLKVKTDVEVLADGMPAYVPFLLRPKQSDILDEIEQAWKEGRSARLVILKGRRQGCSIFLVALLLERILRVPGYECMLAAQDDPSATYLFSKLREFIDQIPEAFFQVNGLTVVQSTQRDIIIQHGQYKKSIFRVATAKRKALGRGAFNNALVLTEFPQWDPGCKKDLTHILPTCRDTRGNIVVFESTARGYEEFQARYEAATKGLNTYSPMFLGAQDHPDARRPFESEREEEMFRASIGMVPTFGGPEERERFDRLLAEGALGEKALLEFFQWYRHVLFDECEGSLDLMKREYPTSPDEAFIGTGRPVFPIALINSHMKLAKAREDAAAKGDLSYDTEGGEIRFEESRHGIWTIYEEPVEGQAYTWFSDVAAGYEVNADGKRESDFSTMKIKHILTQKTVAHLRQHIFPVDLAHELFKASIYYGLAKGFVERNMDGGTVISLLEELTFAGHVGHEILLSVPRIVRLSDGRKSIEREAGFKTTSKTKPKLVDAVLNHLRDHSPPARSTPFNLQTLQEMMRYVRTDTGKTQADFGHDDCVVDEGGCLLACRELRDEVPVLSKVPPRVTSEQRAYAQMFLRYNGSHGDRHGEHLTSLGEGF